MALRIHPIAFAALAATAGALFQPIEVKAASPYWTVIAASAVNWCCYEYGLQGEEEMFDSMVEYASDKGIAYYQVKNFIDRDSFGEDVEYAIDKMGGCSEIVARIKGRLARSRSGLTGEPGQDYKFFYGDEVDRLD